MGPDFCTYVRQYLADYGYEMMIESDKTFFYKLKFTIRKIIMSMKQSGKDFLHRESCVIINVVFNSI